MNFLEVLPEELNGLLMETLCEISKISIVVFAYVNKSCYQIARKCAKQNNIQRSLKCYEIAAEGLLEILKWASPNYCCKWGSSWLWYWGFHWDCKLDCKICDYAARNGHLDVLQWAKSNGYSWSLDICSCAGENGHLEVLKWARSNGYSWSSDTCALAAQNGHLKVLKWARSNGCDWNSRTYFGAIENGHYHVAVWAITNGCPTDLGDNAENEMEKVD